MGGIGMIILGILTAIPVNVIGKLYIGEALLGLAAPVMIPLVFGLHGAYGRLAKILMIAMFISWAGYIGSDLYRGTPLFDYVRGWSRWVALIVLYVNMAYFGSKNIRYVLFFLLGWGIGSSLYPLAMGGAMGLKWWWKFHAGFGVCFAFALFGGRFGALPAAIAMLAAGALSVALDLRSTMLICVMTAIIALLSGRRGKSGNRGRFKLTTTRILLAILTVVICAGASMFILQKVGERLGYSERFRGSNIKRLTNVEIAYNILKESPLIGYGSWARDPEIARIRDKIVEKRLGYRAMRSEAQEDLVIVHSQILQSWVEGGLLGLVFFAVFGWQLADKGIRLLMQLRYDPVVPAIAFLIMNAAWHYLGSPFGGGSRVVIACTCAAVCHLAVRAQEAPALAFARIPPLSVRRSMVRPMGG